MSHYAEVCIDHDGRFAVDVMLRGESVDTVGWFDSEEDAVIEFRKDYPDVELVGGLVDLRLSRRNGPQP